MSLAMFAASINDNSNITDQNDSNYNDLINQKRHKKTLKKYPKIESFDTNKVNSVLQKIHENDDDDDDKDAFNPPPKPESAGVNKTIPQKETFVGTPFETKFEGMQSSLGNKFMGKAPSSINELDDKLDMNDYSNYGDERTNEQYYKRILPGYKKTHQPSYSSNAYETPSQDVLMQKLNYIISLLEDQQDEKTSNIAEEVILYSFLGIFIIFIADTFVKAGKYVR